MEIKKAHFYWGSDKKMPFLNFLSILTFRDLNPEWELILYTSEDSVIEPTWKTHEQRHIYDGKDYMSICQSLCDKVVKLNLEELGFSNNIHDVHKADILRLVLLCDTGGLWSDMDVIWVKPAKQIDIQGADVTLVLSSVPTYGQRECHSSGVLYSSVGGNPFYLRVLEYINKMLPLEGYQTVGPDLLNNIYPSIEYILKAFPGLKFINLPYEIFYPYTPDTCPEFFSTSGKKSVGGETFAVHWFNGHQENGRLACHITPDNVGQYEGSHFFKCIERFA